MARVVSKTSCVVVLSVLTAAALARPAAQSPPAAGLLTAAREAIGGDARVRALRSLRLTGTVWASQTVVGGQTRVTEDPLEIRVMFPDTFLQVSAFVVGPQVIEDRTGFRGDRMLSMVGGAPSSPEGMVYARRKAAELLLLVLARTEPWGGLSFQAIGANALQVRGPNEYGARLDLDPVTRLPLKLAYRERRQVRQPNTMRRAPTGTANARGEAAGAGGSGASSEGLPEIDIVVTPRDHRNVGGLMLPSRITTSAQNIDLWEFRFKEMVVNPPLTAADFGG